MPRARTRELALAASIALVLLLPVASAGSAGWGRAEPVAAAPGATLHLLFVANSSGLLDVAVERDVRCTLVAPDGATTTPCAGDPQLVEAKLLPGGEAYAWDVAAPSAPGVYHVRFERTDLLALPLDAAQAETSFVVADPAHPDEPVAADASHAGPGPAGGSADHLDAVRWLVSLVGGSSTFLVILFAHRLGGRP